MSYCMSYFTLLLILLTVVLIIIFVLTSTYLLTTAFWLFYCHIYILFVSVNTTLLLFLLPSYLLLQIQLPTWTLEQLIWVFKTAGVDSAAVRLHYCPAVLPYCCTTVLLNCLLLILFNMYTVYIYLALSWIPQLCYVYIYIRSYLVCTNQLVRMCSCVVVSMFHHWPTKWGQLVLTAERLN